MDASNVCGPPNPMVRVTPILWLQGVTLAWMLVECGAALFAAALAHSSAMLAFGSDSLVELLSATVVLMQFSPRFVVSEKSASRVSSVLLVALAITVALTTVLALTFHVRSETSVLGIAVLLGALAIMPILAWLKRREALRIDNAALAADAVQSATCAYLALIALAGVGLNALFHISWFDAAAATAALPLLLREAQRAWRGGTCGCC